MAQARRRRGGCALRKAPRMFASRRGNERAPYLSPRHRDRRPWHQIAREPQWLRGASFGSRRDRNFGGAEESRVMAQDLIDGNLLQIRLVPSFCDESLSYGLHIQQRPQPAAESAGDEDAAARQKRKGQVAGRGTEDR